MHEAHDHLNPLEQSCSLQNHARRPCEQASHNLHGSLIVLTPSTRHTLASLVTPLLSTRHTLVKHSTHSHQTLATLSSYSPLAIFSMRSPQQQRGFTNPTMQEDRVTRTTWHVVASVTAPMSQPGHNLANPQIIHTHTERHAQAVIVASCSPARHQVLQLAVPAIGRERQQEADSTALSDNEGHAT